MLNANLFGASPGGGTANPAATLMMMMGFIAIFYFLFFRPQRKQQKEHQALIKGVAKGDEITTVGGVIGTIVHLTGDRITIKSGETRMEVDRSKIMKVNSEG